MFWFFCPGFCFLLTYFYKNLRLSGRKLRGFYRGFSNGLKGELAGVYCFFIAILRLFLTYFLMLVLDLAYADIGVGVFSLFRKTGLDVSFFPGNLCCPFHQFFGNPQEFRYPIQKNI